ncbi:MAG: apolipoprotein N-acyltransferase [Candidatus Actinomarina sp.]
MNAIIAGLLYFLSFPPYDFWYLIFPALYLFYYSLLSSKKSFLSGFIFGCVAYGVILLGIQSIGLEAWIPLTFLMGLMYGVFSKLFSYLNTKSGNNFYVLLAALAVFDLIRAYFPFGGFPWGFPSTVLLTGPIDSPLFFAVPLIFRNFGPTGSSLLLQSLPLVIALGVFSKSKPKNYLKDYSIFLLIIFTIFISNYVVNDYQYTQLETSELNITIVQGNSPCPGAKNRCSNERQKIYDSHLAQTQSLEGNFDLVVWPESSTGFNNDPGVHSRVQNDVSTQALRLDSYFLIGGDRPVQKEYFENYGIFINRKGEVVDQYLKQHPVPFGEYIPFRKYLDWIPPLALVPRDMIRGDGQKIFMVNNTKISTVISFEGSFQRYIRNSVLDGAELVVILTNQASYGESGMSDQFILMSRANAISNDRPIVHAAITGKSAFIDHNGKVISKTELFETTTLNEKLEVRQTETPYSKYGNYLNYIFIIFGALTFARRFIRPVD